MKHYRMEEMFNGWFAGQFMPSVMQWSGGEIALKKYSAGVVQTSYCHPEADKVYIIFKGCIQLGKEEIGPSHIVLVKAGENPSFTCLEDTLALLLIRGDKKSESLITNLKQILQAYQPYYSNMERNDSGISYKDITVVVQGAINPSITPIGLESIREFLPGSRIVLSTWDGENTEGLDYDEVIYTKDPGGYKYTIPPVVLTNNVNRQLVSVQEGLKRTETEYVLKLRTDAIITSNRFLSFFSSFPKKNEKYKIFKHKVLVSDFFTRNKFRSKKEFFPIPFHVSDFFFFGYTEDIKGYFMETRKMTREEQIDYHGVSHPERREIFDYWWHWRMAPEQFFALEALRRKYPGVNMNDWSDWNEENIRQSEEFIMNNFIVLDFNHHGIMIPKFEKLMTENKGEDYKEKGLYTFSIYSAFYDAMFQKNTDFNGWDA